VCKIGPEELAQVLCQLPPVKDPVVQVRTSIAGDAAAYRIDDQRAII
jgi:hypothetical protein